MFKEYFVVIKDLEQPVPRETSRKRHRKLKPHYHKYNLLFDMQQHYGGEFHDLIVWISK